MTTEVEIPLTLHCRSGKREVITWARSADSALVCHLSADNDGTWNITHRPTGLYVNPSRCGDKQNALALLDIYAPMADWQNLPEDPDERHRLRYQLELAYKQFAPDPDIGC